MFLTIVGGAIGIAAVLLAVTYARCGAEMRAARARLVAGSEILKTEGGEIEYAVEEDAEDGVEVREEATAVLSLHGAGGGYDQGLWAAKMAMGDGHKVISVSRYGYLRTPIPRKASIKTQAAIYAALLEHLKVQKVILLGVSAGGPSATQFANDYPERTAALILISAVSEAAVEGDKPAFFIGIINLIQKSDYAYWLFAKFMQPAILNLMGMPAKVYAKLTPAQKEMAQEMLDTMHPMTERYAGTMNDGEMLRREAVTAENVSAPTLILHAKDDALVNFRHAERAHAAIAGSRLESFETGGHGLLPQMEAVQREVREFLQGS